MKRFMLLYNHRRGEKEKKGKVKKMINIIKEEVTRKINNVWITRDKDTIVFGKERIWVYTFSKTDNNKANEIISKMCNKVKECPHHTQYETEKEIIFVQEY